MRMCDTHSTAVVALGMHWHQHVFATPTLVMIALYSSSCKLCSQTCLLLLNLPDYESDDVCELPVLLLAAQYLKQSNL